MHYRWLLWNLYNKFLKFFFLPYKLTFFYKYLKTHRERERERREKGKFSTVKMKCKNSAEVNSKDVSEMKIKFEVKRKQSIKAMLHLRIN